MNHKCLVALALLAFAPAGFTLQVNNGPDSLAVSRIAAPEIDPTSAASGLTLLLGGLAVVRGRTKRATVA
jgi:hypothetical protein